MSRRPSTRGLTLLALLTLPAVAPAQAPARRPLRVVYFDPADRDSAPDARERLDRALAEVQAWYAAEMERNGFGPLTFPLERDADGRLVVHFVRSSRAYAQGEEVGAGEIRDEQVAPALRAEGIEPDREHLVIFANTVFTSQEERGTVVHSSSVYGGLGDHASGTAWVTDCALLDPRNLPAREPIVWDDGVRRYTLGGYNVTYLGGVAHELGHAFGLPHDVETAEQHAQLGWALMGSGNYPLFGQRAGDAQGSFLSRAEATMLARHPLFRPDAAEDRDAPEPQVTWSDVAFEASSGEYTVRGRVDATPRAYAVVVFHDDRAVEADYDATAWVADVDAEGHFAARVGALAPGAFEVRLRCCLASGAERTVAYHATLGDDLTFTSVPELVEEDGE